MLVAQVALRHLFEINRIPVPRADDMVYRAQRGERAVLNFAVRPADPGYSRTHKYNSWRLWQHLRPRLPLRTCWLSRRRY